MPVVPKAPTASGQIADLEEKTRMLFRMLRKAIAQAEGLSYSVGFRSARRTSGDVTVTSTTWVDFDTGLDLRLPAKPSDLISCSVSGVWDAQAFDGCLDVVSVSGGTLFSFGADLAPDNTYTGVGSWFGPSGVFMGIGGPISRRLTPQEVVDGLVTLRLRTRIMAAGSKDMIAITTAPFVFQAVNLGQP